MTTEEQKQMAVNHRNTLHEAIQSLSKRIHTLRDKAKLNANEKFMLATSEGMVDVLIATINFADGTDSELNAKIQQAFPEVWDSWYNMVYEELRLAHKVLDMEPPPFPSRNFPTKPE